MIHPNYFIFKFKTKNIHKKLEIRKNNVIFEKLTESSMFWGITLIIFMFWFATGLFGWLGFLVSFIVIFAFLFGEKIEEKHTFIEEILSTFISKK